VLDRYEISIVQDNLYIVEIQILFHLKEDYEFVLYIQMFY
jgi:hypothetical protein